MRLVIVGLALASSSAPTCDFREVSLRGTEARIRGRENLPSGESWLVPETLKEPWVPMAVTGGDAGEFLKIQGAVVFRDLGLETADDFSEFVNDLEWKTTFIGGGGTARSVLAEGVRTASDEPPEHTIEPHQDMAHNPRYPGKLAFFMLRNDLPDGAGGETVLTDMRGVTNSLFEDGTIDLFEEHGGVLYKKLLWSREFQPTSSFTWQRRLFVETKDDVEAVLRNLSSTTFSWGPDDLLQYQHRLPAVTRHPHTDELVFINGIHTNHRDYFDLAPHIDTSLGSPYDTFFGNGDPIPDVLLDHIRGVWWNNSVAVSLQTGDVVIVDNLLTGHGRLSWLPDLGFQRTMLIAHLDPKS